MISDFDDQRIASELTLSEWVDREIETYHGMQMSADKEKMERVKAALDERDHLAAQAAHQMPAVMRLMEEHQRAYDDAEHLRDVYEKADALSRRFVGSDFGRTQNFLLSLRVGAELKALNAALAVVAEADRKAPRAARKGEGE